MPLYEYRCTSCGHTFEKIQSFSAEPERECPKCHGVLIRPVTAPALRFEGAGWYVNDYAGKGAAKSDPTPSGSTSDAKTGDSKPASNESTAAAAPASAPAPAAPAGSTSTTTASSGS